jgi:hypothetical protein
VEEDLLTTDLNAFLKRNIRLERVDHLALGNLFCGIKITAGQGWTRLFEQLFRVDKWSVCRG